MRKVLPSITFLLVIAPLGRADSVPICPEASLGYYDTSLPNGCALTNPDGSTLGLLSDFSSPSTPDPVSFMVRPSFVVEGFAFLRITGANIKHKSPSLNFNASVYGPEPHVGYSLFFCSGSAGAAEGSLSVNGSPPAVVSVSADGGCSNDGSVGFALTGASNSVETVAVITSGLGEMYYEIYFTNGIVVPEPGSIVLLGIGLAGLAGFGRNRLRKARVRR